MSNIIVFEGISCAGKSTMIQEVQNYYQNLGIECINLNELLSNKPFENIEFELKEILTNKDIIYDNFEMFLLFAIRLCEKVRMIKCLHFPENSMLLVDRFELSLLLKGIYIHKLDKTMVETIVNYIIKDCRPVGYIYLEIDYKNFIIREGDKRNSKVWNVIHERFLSETNGFTEIINSYKENNKILVLNTSETTKENALNKIVKFLNSLSL
ncbi:MAG: hypothetical protein WC879_10340 [Melioribacteraceae bacterium]